MHVAILGPLEVSDDDGRPVQVSGARVRALLTRLAVDAGRPVGLDALVHAVWGDNLPAEQVNALQTLISRLRRAIGTHRLLQESGGYRLAVDPSDVDVVCFEQLAAAGAQALHRGDAQLAASVLAEALTLWRGSVELDGFADRLDELRRRARADRVEAELRVADPGGDVALVAELEALTAEDPLDERCTGQLMRALAAQGRQADALRAYERLRARLADELGVDPARDVQQIHLAVLRGELRAAPALPSVPAEDPGRAQRTNLKAQLTSFVGRDAEVSRIGKLLEQNRLVTLVGPGGAGKTRLASEATARILDVAPDGVWLVELAPVTTDAGVVPAVLSALGLRETHLLDRPGRGGAARDPLSRLLDALADKRTVLVLDNCEHLIDASARLADQLLGRCPELRVLATSREPLGIVGEVLVAVQPLGQPAPGTDPTDAVAYPAVRLFADRAADVRPDFAIDATTTDTVIEIVRRLDGLPLAIELAAARLRAIPLAGIATRLSDRFRLLTGGSRTALPRHRTLRAVVEWSWDLLTPAERALVEQLAVFPAGVTVDSAAAVAAADPADVADLLASLVDKSLLQPVEDGRRLRMLETIREYGVERLAERGELAAVRQRHAAHFAAVLAEAEPHLISSDQLPWFELLSAERENMLAGLHYLRDIGDATGALTMATSLAGHSMMLGANTELLQWLAEALAVPGDVDPALRVVAETIHVLNVVATERGTSAELGDTMRRLRELSLEFEHVTVPTTSFAALLPPAAAFFSGDPELSERYIQRTVDAGDPWSSAAARMLRAALAENSGDVELLRRENEIALAAFRRLGERWGTASALRALGLLHILDGDLDAALAAHEEALALTSELRSTDDQGFILGSLAEIASRLGDTSRAREYARRMLEGATANGSAAETGYALAMCSVVELRAGELGAADALQRQATQRIDSMPGEHPAQGHIRAVVRAAAVRCALAAGDLDGAEELGADAYATAVATRDMPVVASIGVVLAGVAAARGATVAAAELLGAATRLRGADDPTAPEIRVLTDHLRTELGGPGFDTAYGRGMALDRAAAVERLAPGAGRP